LVCVIVFFNLKFLVSFLNFLKVIVLQNLIIILIKNIKSVFYFINSFRKKKVIKKKSRRNIKDVVIRYIYYLNAMGRATVIWKYAILYRLTEQQQRRLQKYWMNEIEKDFSNLYYTRRWIYRAHWIIVILIYLTTMIAINWGITETLYIAIPEIFYFIYDNIVLKIIWPPIYFIFYRVLYVGLIWNIFLIAIIYKFIYITIIYEFIYIDVLCAFYNYMLGFTFVYETKCSVAESYDLFRERSRRIVFRFNDVTIIWSDLYADYGTILWKRFGKYTRRVFRSFDGKPYLKRVFLRRLWYIC